MKMQSMTLFFMAVFFTRSLTEKGKSTILKFNINFIVIVPAF